MTKAQRRALLAFHVAVDVQELWTALQGVARTTLPFDDCMLLLSFVGARMARCYLSTNPLQMEQSALMAEGIKRSPPWTVIAANPGIRYVGTPECFRTHEAWIASDFYRRHMADKSWDHPLATVFWQGRDVMASFSIFRSEAAGPFLDEDRSALDEVYDDVHVGLLRTLHLYRDTTFKLDLVSLLGRWSRPCTLLNWNLEVVLSPGGSFSGRVPDRIMKCLVHHKGVVYEKLARGERLARARLRIDTVRDHDWTADVYVISAGQRELMPPWWLVEFGEDAPSIRPFVADHCLTPRESQVVECVAEGLSNWAISERLGITEGTVKRHLHNIHGKTGSRNKLALLAMLRGP